jgi:hypothetical protein
VIAVGIAYAELGWPVLPLEERGKRPNGRLVRHGLQNATTDCSVIKGWWRAAPNSNIGIATGRGLLVLDEDGDIGADSRAALERKHGQLPDTPRSVTGGGGGHWYFSVDRHVANSAGQLAPGLDVRGDGGYVVAAPSVHSSGRTYEWDLAPGDVPIAPAPAWLLRLLEAPRRSGSAPAEKWRLLVTGVQEGQRNDTAARLCGHLLGKGIDPHVAHELVVAWDAQRNRPPLGRDEITKVCESIAARELRKREQCGRA